MLYLCKEQKANKLMDNITSGDVEVLVLKGMSAKYNTIQEEISNRQFEKFI